MPLDPSSHFSRQLPVTRKSFVLFTFTSKYVRGHALDRLYLPIPMTIGYKDLHSIITPESERAKATQHPFTPFFSLPFFFRPSSQVDWNQLIVQSILIVRPHSHSYLISSTITPCRRSVRQRVHRGRRRLSGILRLDLPLPEVALPVRIGPVCQLYTFSLLPSRLCKPCQ